MPLSEAIKCFRAQLLNTLHGTLGYKREGYKYIIIHISTEEISMLSLALLLVFCPLLDLGSAWNQPSTCLVRESGDSGGLERELREIKETLQDIADKLIGEHCSHVPMLSHVNAINL